MNKFNIMETVHLAIAAFLATVTEGNAYDSTAPVSDPPCRIGGLWETVSGKHVAKYLGIPYAQAPINELRFKPPEPRIPCANNRTIYVYEKSPKRCYQAIDKHDQTLLEETGIEFSEDCLLLNIYTPKHTQSQPNLPTIVWISGESFYNGSISSGLDNPAQFVLDYNVVVVQVQYRLGSFGFINLGYGGINGNMGLLDQAMALQWVKKYIKVFRGNPEDITIMGQGAGAVSVGYHMMSNLTRHLFRKAVMQSGSPFNHKTYMPPEESIQTSMMILQITKCKNIAGEQKQECLLKLPADDLVKADGTLPNLMPTSDGNYMQKSPLQAIRHGDYVKMPVLAGLVQNEGMPTIKRFLRAAKDMDYNKFSQSNFDFLLKIMTTFTGLTGDELKSLGEFYLKKLKTSTANNYGEAAFQFYGDVFLSCPTITFMTNISSGGAPVYFYYFNHRSQRDKHPKYTEVMQGSEIQYQFGRPFRASSEYTTTDEELSRSMMRLWKSFIESGKPEEWSSFSDNFTKILETHQEPHKLLKRDIFCAEWRKYLNFPLEENDT